MANGTIRKDYRRVLVDTGGYTLEAVGHVRILQMIGCGVGTSDNIAQLLGSENLPKQPITSACMAVNVQTPCAVLLLQTGQIQIVGNNGIALQYSVIVDAVLTWIV